MTLGDFIKVDNSKVNILLFFNDVVITQNGICMSFNELMKYQNYVINRIEFINTSGGTYSNEYGGSSGLAIYIYLEDPKPGVIESLAKALSDGSNK